jgi:hypothetical protein
VIAKMDSTANEVEQVSIRYTDGPLLNGGGGAVIGPFSTRLMKFLP